MQFQYSKFNKEFKENNLPYQYVYCQSQADKYQLAEFIYNNTDNFVMNTFALLWENRSFWNNWRPLIMFDENGKIIGIHAFSEKEVTNKRYLKTYYIVTDKDHRGEGIAKKLTLQVMKDFNCKYANFYVNSVQNSDGDKFYRKLITNRPEKKNNEFGTVDLVFKGNIRKILAKTQ